MDVRKWCEHKADEAYLAMCKTEMQDCRGPIADAFAPTITKLVDALRKVAIGLHELDGTIDHAAEFENCDEWHCEIAKAALDAHDAAIRERTLQEVFSRWDQEGEQDTWNWLCETLDEEKRGSK